MTMMVETMRGGNVNLNHATPVDRSAFISIDLGGTKMLGIVVNHKGEILHRARRATPPQGGNAAIADAILAFLREMAERAGADNYEVAGVGIGTPGYINADGVILDASNLYVQNLPLARIVEQNLHVPCLVLHDVKAAALGEVKFGAGVGLQNVGYLNLGTGVSIGLLLGGKIHQGAHGRAGELGHVQIDTSGPRCACGRNGCLEVFASGPALERRAAHAVLAPTHGLDTARLAQALDAQETHIAARAIASAAHEGDALALHLLQESAEYIGQAIGGLSNVLDLDALILGGGLMNIGDLFLEKIRAAAKRYLPIGHHDQLAIVLARLGNDSGAMGVAAALLERHQSGSGEMQQGI